MADNYEKLFKNIQFDGPSDGLLDSILKKIAVSKKHRAQRRFVFGILTLIASITAFFPALQYFNSEIMQSGFYHYVLLIVSDGAAILGYWQSFSFLVIESLPILALVLILAVLWIFFISLHQIAVFSKVVFLQSKLN